MEECQEPRCTRQATSNWGGKKVCHDHYEEYKEKHEQMLMDLNDIG